MPLPARGLVPMFAAIEAMNIAYCAEWRIRDVKRPRALTTSWRSLTVNPMNATRGALVACSLVVAASTAAVSGQDSPIFQAAPATPATGGSVVLVPHRAI